MTPRKDSVKLLVAACVALVAVLVFLRRDHEDTRPTVKDAQAETGTESAADLVMPMDSVGPAGRLAVLGLPATWTVRVRSSDGLEVPGASITAQYLGDGDKLAALQGEGSADWDDVPAGLWALDVRADGYPNWSKPITLAPGQVLKTNVTLGLPATIVGTVVDTNGQPCATHFVGFVEGKGDAPVEVMKWLALPHTRTEAGGGFRAQLPSPGSYRMFIGYGGRILFQDHAAVEHEAGGELRVNVVVPVPTRLVIRAIEDQGALRPTAYGVSIYRRAAILDLERPPVPMPEPVIPDLDDPSLDADAREELRLSIEAEAKEVDVAALARRLSVVPDGWRVDRSAILDGRGLLIIDHLPPGEELRFAARRGQEVFRVDGSASVNPTAPTEVLLTFPADGSPRAGTTASAGTVIARPRLIPETKKPLSVGATWY